MQLFKILFKKISKIPKAHLLGIIIVLVAFISLAEFFFTNDFEKLSSFLIKAIVMLVVMYWIYFQNKAADELLEIRKENEEKEIKNPSLKGHIHFPTPSMPEPDFYGSYVNVKVTHAPVDKSEELKEAIANFNLSKSKEKTQQKQPRPLPNTEPKPSEPKPVEPTPIVKEGESKAEKEGNTIINEEGKPIVKPNYKMIASEWVKNNLGLLNKICNDAYAISGGSGSYSATIPAAYLPEEKASWIVIGKTLVAEDDISSFKILKEGLEITVS